MPRFTCCFGARVEAGETGLIEVPTSEEEEAIFCADQEADGAKPRLVHQNP